MNMMLRPSFYAITLLSLLICWSDSQGQDRTNSNYVQEVLQWQSENSQRLKRPDGWLALTGHFWLQEGENRVSTGEGATIRLPDSAPSSIHAIFRVIGDKVQFIARSDHRFECKGSATKEEWLEVDSAAKEADCPDQIVIESRYRLQLVRRSGRLAVRVRDPDNDTLKRFGGKTWYPVDNKWRVKASYRSAKVKQSLEGTNIKGLPIALDILGEATFVQEGEQYTLLAQEEGDQLFFVFHDRTCGQDSYGPCRFLNVEKPRIDLAEPVDIVLDFNQAYNPPCAVSPHTLCPLPPKQNRLPIEIRAGESYLPRARRLHRMEMAMGPKPDDSRRVPLDVREVSREQLDGYSRIKLSFASESTDRVPAWLLIPDGAKKNPAMLCLHQTISIGKDEPVGLGAQESKRQALHLVKRGYVCLAPDYPSFGEYTYDFKDSFGKGSYQSGTMKAIWNNMRAVDLLCSLAEVDPERIGAIGHSLGGHNTLFTAAFDERLKVAVSSCGFCSFHRYYGGNLKGWTSDRYMPKIASVYGNDPRRMPFDFDDVLLAIYPRGIFAMSPQHDANFDVVGVREVVEKIAPFYKNAGLSGNLEVAYPDAGHEWPEAEREQAYAFIDRVLKK